MEDRGVEPKLCYSKIWKWQLPMNVKLFVRLLMEHRILTWDNLIKRGFQGPRICVICKESENFVLHLFGDCNFIKNIWQPISKELNLVNN